MAISIAVIIPTKNEAANIRRCLKSIKKQTTKPVEIIVVDNHSTDSTPIIARQLGATVYAQGPERSSQRNFGAGKAKADYLFFIDADMELEDDVILEAANLLNKEPRLKAIIVPEKSVGTGFWAQTRTLERSFYLNEPNIEAARIFQKKAFIELGGYDPSLTAAEDWDLHQRFSKKGKVGRIKAKIIHHEGKLSLASHLTKKYYYAKDIARYAQKNPLFFKQQSGRFRFYVFAKNWKKLIAHPSTGLGVLVLKSLEYFTYLWAKIR